jgi:hypothetical protein
LGRNGQEFARKVKEFGSGDKLAEGSLLMLAFAAVSPARSSV